MRVYDDKLRVYKFGALKFVEREHISYQCNCCFNKIEVPCDVIGFQSFKKIENELEFINCQLEGIEKILSTVNIDKTYKDKIENLLIEITENVRKHNEGS